MPLDPSSPEFLALIARVASLEGSMHAHGVELGRIRRATNDDGAFGTGVGDAGATTGQVKEFARGAWCVTGLLSGSTFSTTDPTLWDSQFDAAANSSLRIFKGSLTRFGELHPHYDGSDVHTRHRLFFVNRGASFDTKLYFRAFSGSISTGSNGAVLKHNGSYKLVTAEGSQTITIRQGVNNLAIMHKAGRVIDVWAQFIDNKSVFGLDVTCGKIAGSDGDNGNSGGGVTFGGTT